MLGFLRLAEAAQVDCLALPQVTGTWFLKASGQTLDTHVRGTDLDPEPLEP